MAKRIHRRRDADPQEGLKKYGRTTFADSVNKKYPIDTPGRIKAAWAYIHQPVNASKYTDKEVRTIKFRVRRAAKAGKDLARYVSRAIQCTSLGPSPAGQLPESGQVIPPS
jgi:hypothetical protein